MNNQWVKDQIRFATCLGNMLDESKIEWSKELDFNQITEWFEDDIY